MTEPALLDRKATQFADDGAKLGANIITEDSAKQVEAEAPAAKEIFRRDQLADGVGIPETVMLSNDMVASQLVTPTFWGRNQLLEVATGVVIGCLN